jgi:hypothetical protein
MRRLVAVAAFLMLMAGQAMPCRGQGFSLGDAANYGILLEANGTLGYNNSTEIGNVGIGNGGTFQGNGPGTITGNINFSAASGGSATAA